MRVNFPLHQLQLGGGPLQETCHNESPIGYFLLVGLFFFFGIDFVEAKLMDPNTPNINTNFDRRRRNK